MSAECSQRGLSDDRYCDENFINPTENNVTPSRSPSFIFAKKTNDDKEIFQSNRDGMCRLRSTYQYSPQ